MSTRSVLTLAGQIIGNYYGGPIGGMIGGFIGGAVGGYIDPEVIQGPKIGDTQVQTSRDGVPRPIVYGIAPIVGNLIARGELEIVTVEERQGKGATTPVIESEEAYMTYAIRICEASLQADGTTRIIGVRRAWENEKLVLDRSVGPDPETEQVDDYDGFAGRWQFFLQQQAKSSDWMTNKRLYDGSETQLPDSALEAIYGVGNTPAYRGSAYCRFQNENLTKTGGAIPTYRWEVVGRGSVGSRTEDMYDVKSYSGFRKSHWPLLDDETEYTLVGSRFSAEYPVLSNLQGDTIQEIVDQATMYGEAPSQYLGYAARDELTYGFDLTTETFDPTDVDTVYLLFNIDREISGYLDYEAYGGGGTICAAAQDDLWLVDKRGAMVTETDQVGFVYPGPFETFQDCSETRAVVGSYPLVIAATRKRQCHATPGYRRPTYGRNPVRIPESSAFTFDFHTGYLQPIPDSVTEVAGTYKVLQLEDKQLAAWGYYYNAYDVGPAIPSGDGRYSSQTFWEAAYTDAVARGLMSAGLVYGVDYPVAASTACRNRMLFDEIDTDGLYLYEIVDDVCERVGLTADKRDTSELTDVVLGYTLGRQMNAAEAIRGTQQAYMFDMPEYDAKLRGVKRGAAPMATITEDDLVWIGDGEDDNPTQVLMREQGVEYPQKIHVVSYDPATCWVPTKETAQRRSINIESLTESTLSFALTLTHDERAKIADRSLKIAWAEHQGSFKMAVPERLSALVPSDTFIFDSRRYRIDRLVAHDGYLEWECRVDRQSAYTSNVTGSEPTTPSTPPTSLIAGPTLLTVLNIPAQTEADEVAGVYVAVAGVMSGWGGAALQMSADDGASWVSLGTLRLQTPQGYVTSPLDDDLATYGSPVDDEFGVMVYGGTLDSATASQLAAGANRFGISNDEGQTWEIASFGTAVEDSSRRYTLSDLERGLDETTLGEYAIGDWFCRLANLTFIPLDESLDGQTLLFRAVTLGTSEDNAYTVSIVFHVRDVIWDGGHA